MSANLSGSKTVKVLGIDPGSRLMGFGVVTKSGNVLKPLDYGTVRINPKLEMHERLLTIHNEVTRLLQLHKPDHVALEKIFFAKDPLAAVKLGQARGVVLLATAQARTALYEYSPNEIKMAVSGYGHADKEQIAKMVTLILGIKDFKTSDTSDALAIAICHLNSYSYRSRVLNPEVSL